MAWHPCDESNAREGGTRRFDLLYVVKREHASKYEALRVGIPRTTAKDGMAEEAALAGERL